MQKEIHIYTFHKKVGMVVHIFNPNCWVYS